MSYECVLFCVDDVHCINDDLLRNMSVIMAKLKLKGEKIEEPDMYLGVYLSNITNVNVQECWAMCSDNYCTSAVTNLKYVLKKNSLRLP